MFVDASVIAAILNEETDVEELLQRLSEANSLFVSPMVRFEAVLAVARSSAAVTRTTVTERTLSDAREMVDALVAQLGAQSADISHDIGSSALEAAMRYGKIVRHPAALNFGDCFAYACAKSLNVPLLYKGGDFARTDLA